jgi:hypothetical protein
VKKFIFRYLSVPLTNGFWNILINPSVAEIVTVFQADMMKKHSPRHLIALKCGLPAFCQKGINKNTVMCITIKSRRFGEVFHHVCLKIEKPLKMFPTNPFI